jgi:membrane protein required for colicin V production
VIFDAVVLCFVALAAGIGAWKGFAWQLGAILAPVAGISAGWPLSAALAPHLSLRAPLDRWAALGLLYVGITLLVFLVALGLRKLLERAQLRAWDRHLGFAVGALKGFALAVAFTLAALAFSADLRARIPETRTGEFMAQALRTVRPVLPAAATDLLGPWFQLLQRRNA